jgi:asparagine synthase (glutamine-hydrolysing)
MCGIAGIATVHGRVEREAIVRMREMLVHRGPDDAGDWISDDLRVGLGHRRLSIVDLTPAGHQPMVDARAAIVFNGEIYNHVELRDELAATGYHFRSRSDTEVILAAYARWGTDCVMHLDGMFAFALCDLAEQRVLLARDRGGEKPLYYSLSGGVLRFASELKALLADPAASRRIDPRALDAYLAFGYVPGELVIFEGVAKLPPAHALVFDLADGDTRTWRYWQVPDLAADERDLESRLEASLERAVRRQLVADVPVGVLLSGGIDSSLVTAMAARAGRAVRTFTVKVPGDDVAHARRVAAHLGTEHIELPADELGVDVLPLLARQLDEPMADSSVIPMYALSRVVRRHCTVALGGDGGDELFGGYAQYNRLLWTQQRLGWIPRPVGRAVAHIAENQLPVGFKGRALMQSLHADLNAELPVTPTMFDASTRAKLGRWEPVAEALAPQPRAPDLLQRATRADFAMYLPDDLLVKVDRASMLCSLEVRCPFLDREVIELAFRDVPSELKASVTTRKVLLKRLARRLLPEGFDLERKQGFSIPLADWLTRDPWRRTAREIVGESTLVDRDVALRVLNGPRNQERVFALVMLELWRREYGASL